MFSTRSTLLHLKVVTRGQDLLTALIVLALAALVVKRIPLGRAVATLSHSLHYGTSRGCYASVSALRPS